MAVIITKTIRFPDYLHDQIAQRARIAHRSFTAQVVVMLEEMIDAEVGADLEMIRRMLIKPSS